MNWAVIPKFARITGPSIGRIWGEIRVPPNYPEYCHVNVQICSDLCTGFANYWGTRSPSQNEFCPNIGRILVRNSGKIRNLVLVGGVEFGLHLVEFGLVSTPQIKPQLPISPNYSDDIRTGNVRLWSELWPNSPNAGTTFDARIMAEYCHVNVKICSE